MDITGALDVDRYACNATLLGMIFEFEDTTAEEVTEELCQVEMSNLERWAEKLRQHFNTATYVMEVSENKNKSINTGGSDMCVFWMGEGRVLGV